MMVRTAIRGSGKYFFDPPLASRQAFAKRTRYGRGLVIAIVIVILQDSLPLVRSVHLALELTSRFKRGLGDQATCRRATNVQVRLTDYVPYYAHLHTYVPYYEEHSVLGKVRM